MFNIRLSPSRSYVWDRRTRALVRKETGRLLAFCQSLDAALDFLTQGHGYA